MGDDEDGDGGGQDEAMISVGGAAVFVGLFFARSLEMDLVFSGSCSAAVWDITTRYLRYYLLTR